MMRIRLALLSFALCVSALTGACGTEGGPESSADRLLPTDPSPNNYGFWRDAWDGEHWNVAFRVQKAPEDALRASFARSFDTAAQALGGAPLSALGIVGRVARMPLMHFGLTRRGACDFRGCPTFGFVTLKHERFPWDVVFGAALFGALDLSHSKAEGAMRLAWNTFAGMPEVWFAEPDLALPKNLVRWNTAKPASAALSAQPATATKLAAATEPAANWQEYQKSIRLPEAEDFIKKKGWQAREIVVAVLDTGIDGTHPQLKNRMFKLPIEGVKETPGTFSLGGTTYFGDQYGIDASWEPSLPADIVTLSPGSADAGGPGKLCPPENVIVSDCSHGSHVGGLIAAEEGSANGAKVRGVCSSCKLLALRAPLSKVENGILTNGDIRDAAQIRGMQFTSNLLSAKNTLYVNVLNMSLGQFTSSRGMRAVIDSLHGAGIVLVAAAGNQNTDRLSYPAAYENVTAVCATSSTKDPNGFAPRGLYAKAVFSNFGEWVDMCAPGQNILSTVPGGSIKTEDGTSQAAPIVAGAAALLMSLEDAQGFGIDGRSARIRARLESRSNWNSLYSDPANAAYQFKLPDDTGVEFLGRGFLDIANALAETRLDTRTNPPQPQVTGGCIASSIGAESPRALYDFFAGMPFVPSVFALALWLKRRLFRK